MAKRFGQNLVIIGDGYSFENVLLSVFERIPRRFQSNNGRLGFVAEIHQHSPFLLREAFELAFSYFECGDLNQLVGTVFADQHCDFVAAWCPAIPLDKFFDRAIALPTASAIFRQQLIRYPADFESGVSALRIPSILDFIPKRPNLASESIA